MSDKKVKIYSTAYCPYCVYAKEYFDGKGVEYEDVDVSSDPVAAKEMIVKSGQRGVPVVDIGGKIFVGFQPDAFDGELGK
jgi:glutaredoxin-like YruB-family protein